MCLPNPTRAQARRLLRPLHYRHHTLLNVWTCFLVSEARKTEDSAKTARVQQKSGARRNKGKAEKSGKWIENFLLRKAVKQQNFYCSNKLIVDRHAEHPRLTCCEITGCQPAIKNISENPTNRRTLRKKISMQAIYGTTCWEFIYIIFFVLLGGLP